MASLGVLQYTAETGACIALETTGFGVICTATQQNMRKSQVWLRSQTMLGN
jgi:hypothetical protein